LLKALRTKDNSDKSDDEDDSNHEFEGAGGDDGYYVPENIEVFRGEDNDDNIGKLVQAGNEESVQQIITECYDRLSNTKAVLYSSFENVHGVGNADEQVQQIVTDCCNKLARHAFVRVSPQPLCRPFKNEEEFKSFFTEKYELQYDTVTSYVKLKAPFLGRQDLIEYAISHESRWAYLPYDDVKRVKDFNEREKVFFKTYTWKDFGIIEKEDGTKTVWPNATLFKENDDMPWFFYEHVYNGTSRLMQKITNKSYDRYARQAFIKVCERKDSKPFESREQFEGLFKGKYELQRAMLTSYVKLKAPIRRHSDLIAVSQAWKQKFPLVPHGNAYKNMDSKEDLEAKEKVFFDTYSWEDFRFVENKDGSREASPSGTLYEANPHVRNFSHQMESRNCEKRKYVAQVCTGTDTTRYKKFREDQRLAKSSDAEDVYKRVIAFVSKFYNLKWHLDNDGHQTNATLENRSHFTFCNEMAKILRGKCGIANGDDISFMDLGSSYGSLLWIVAQLLPLEFPESRIRCIGYEYASIRHVIGCNASRQMLQADFKRDTQILKNTNVKLEARDLYYTDTFEGNIAFTFDKAFTPDLCIQVIWIFLSSENTRVLISCKASNNTRFGSVDFRFWDIMNQIQGIEDVGQISSLKMKHSSESATTFHVYKKSETFNKETGKENLQQYIRQAFELDKQLQLNRENEVSAGRINLSFSIAFVTNISILYHRNLKRTTRKELIKQSTFKVRSGKYWRISAKHMETTWSPDFRTKKGLRNTPKKMNFLSTTQSMET